MKVNQFKNALNKLAATNSRNEKKEIIKGVSSSPAAISFLSGSEFDSAGLGKKTVLSVAQDVFGDDVDGKPTVSENLEQFDDTDGESKEMSVLHNHMDILADLSGNEMKEHLSTMFESFNYPSVVAHACLDDWPTGCGDSTIAKAMDVKDSLPFYEGVHEIAAADDPLTSPELGSAFKPMLAVPESRGRPDNPVAQMKIDGYRAIIHISGRSSDKRVRAFSRRMNDITESLPELQEVEWPAGEYIIDGEIIAETGSYSDTSERIGRKGENVERDVEMQFSAFDTIVYAGEVVWDKPYRYRYNKMKGLDLNTGDTFNLLPLIEDIEQALDWAAENEQEGIIIKDIESAYEFDKRSSSWQKVKLDDESCDLKIAGFDEGEGRLDGTLGRVKLETSDGVFVGYSGSGFTDAERDEIWNNKEEWLGRVVEIEARGLGTENKLRMPIFVRDRSDDGDADSWSRVQEIMKEL